MMSAATEAATTETTTAVTTATAAVETKKTDIEKKAEELKLLNEDLQQNIKKINELIADFIEKNNYLQEQKIDFKIVEDEFFQDAFQRPLTLEKVNALNDLLLGFESFVKNPSKETAAAFDQKLTKVLGYLPQETAAKVGCVVGATLFYGLTGTIGFSALMATTMVGTTVSSALLASTAMAIAIAGTIATVIGTLGVGILLSVACYYLANKCLESFYHNKYEAPRKRVEGLDKLHSVAKKQAVVYTSSNLFQPERASIPIQLPAGHVGDHLNKAPEGIFIQDYFKPR